MDDIANERGKVTADRAKEALSGLFAWAIDKSYLDASPVHNIRRRSTNASRERVLNEQELRDVWRSCRDDDYGRIIKLLILTGQRRAKIGHLAWSEIDFEKAQIDLPSARTKNKLHTLCRYRQRQRGLSSAFPATWIAIFCSARATAASKAGGELRSLDARINARRSQIGMKPMPDWVIHDLRRSVNTLLNEKGVAQPHIIEAIMNHISGHKANVAGVYNKVAYLDEKRRALEEWGEHIAALMEVAR